MLGRRPIVDAPGRLTLGQRLVLNGRTTPILLTKGPEGHLELGDGVFLNSGVNVHASTHVVIGAGSRLANDVVVIDNDFHEVAPGSGVRRAPIRIGKDVWIGVRAIVLPGVSIGDGSVVAAGTIVTKDVPTGSLVAGVPGRVVQTFDLPPGYRRA